MRCLYCGKQLALFRRLTGSGEFCSDAHKQSYHEEYNRLALTRLIAAQTKSEEMKSSLKAPSTMQLAAAGERKPMRALEEARGSASSQRWTGAPAQARVLPAAPVEPAPPSSASFFLTRPVPAEAAIPQPQATDLNEYRLQPKMATASWSPALETNEPVPPHAGPLESTSIPRPANNLSGIHVAPASAIFAVAEPAVEIGVPMRPIAGLQPRPPVDLDLIDFAPQPRSQPASCVKFEGFRFAVMVFGRPPLEVLPEGLEFERVEASIPVEAHAMPDPPFKAPDSPKPAAPQPIRTAPIPIAVKSQPAAEPLRENDILAKPEKVGPKLPTIPAARRTAAPMIPSIVQPPPEQAPEASKSLWSALRRYMKR